MKELLKNLFNPENFIPHGHCYLWKPGLVWLHVLSDTLIALAYYFIPLMLLYFIQKRKDFPVQGIFWLFGAFIVSCGTTHLLEVWTVWHPAYWLSGSLKAVTAVVSFYTVLELFPLIPQALAAPSPTQLETANQKLAREANERALAEVALKQSEAQFRSIFEGASIGIEIIDLTGRTVARNPALQKMLGYAENAQFDFPCGQGVGYQELLARGRNQCQVGKGFLPWERDNYQMEKRYLCKNGQLLWCHVAGYLVRDTEGNPQFGIRMVEDITEQKQTLKQLQHYQERLEDLVIERTADLKKENEQLSWEATHDALTELINRREFEQRLEGALAGVRNQNQQHTLCFLDLDRFKIVNDTCGHAAGDELLRQISALLQTHVRHTDVLARLGGDEFGLLLYNCSVKQGMQVAQSLQEAMQAFRFVRQDKTFSIGVSIGMVRIVKSLNCGDAPLQSLEKVLSAADAACYQAKNRGRNRIHVYQPEDEEIQQELDRKHWVTKINQAMNSPQSTVLSDNQFCLYYQPIVSLPAYQFNREYYEVLLRLVDEKGEVIPPMAFIPAAERYDLMPSIDRWVINKFFGTMAQQVQESKNRCLYAINLSAASINDENFADFVEQLFKTYEIRPETICFEITENIAIAHLNKVTKLLGFLKALGCQVTLDDFGSSMCSFRYLQQLPFDYLKISGDLIKKLPDDVVTYEMVKAINHIAHVMGIQTIAKFVATEAILENVRALGINYAQGYGIAAPRPLMVRPTLKYEPSLLRRLCS